MVSDNIWFARPLRSDRPFRLYCFPYAGGNAAAYAGWQSAMPPHIDVCGVQLPGRGARCGEAPIDDLAILVDEIAGVLRRTADRPFAFFGHSLGALVAFEVSRRLARPNAVQPRHLFVSGCHAPRRRNAPRGYHRLDDAALVGVLKDYGATPPEILEQADLMALLLPTVRADFALAENYRYRPAPPLHVPVTALAGREDAHSDIGQVDAWAEETDAVFSSHWFDGGHFFLHSQRDEVIGRVVSALAASESLPQCRTGSADA